MEASIEHIERDTADIKADIRTMRANARGDLRLMFGAISSAVVGLAANMGEGFQWF